MSNQIENNTSLVVLSTSTDNSKKLKLLRSFRRIRRKKPNGIHSADDAFFRRIIKYDLVPYYMQEIDNL